MRDANSGADDFECEADTVEIPAETFAETAAWWERERLERDQRPTRDIRPARKVAA
jgi:hypothetical protein